MWTPFKDGLHPAVIATPLPALQLVSPFLPPPCGLTPCDNTDIISGYNNYWPLRTPKQVRYRIINLSDDDGGNATVSQAQIRLQHQALIDAFRPYNITLELTVDLVRNTSLRQRFVLSNCRIGKIGNRHCDPECDHPRTGHDGGDCLRLGPCYNWKRQNGVCNTECNSVHYDYDDGDCCDPEVTDVLKTCFDPESPDRRVNRCRLFRCFFLGKLSLRYATFVALILFNLFFRLIFFFRGHSQTSRQQEVRQHNQD